jgi:hypothetical protein
VGLLRSEFLFMDRRAAPDEDEQARSYAAVAHALGPERILVIRTLDVGGDKPIAYLDLPREENPFLGERGVRLTLARPPSSAPSCARAARVHRGQVAVMFPMIATLAEFRRARALLEEERAALGVPAIPVGIMVETTGRGAARRPLRRRGGLLLHRHQRPDAVHARHGPHQPAPRPAGGRAAPGGAAADRAHDRRRARARPVGGRVRRARRRPAGRCPCCSASASTS